LKQRFCFSQIGSNDFVSVKLGATILFRSNWKLTFESKKEGRFSKKKK